MRTGPVSIGAAFLLLAASCAYADDSPAEATRTLQDAGISTADSSLLDYFRQRTITRDDKRVKLLLKQLGDRSFTIREESTKALIELGPMVLPTLRAARTDPDLERRKRLNSIIGEIEAQMRPALTLAAARLIAEKRPENAAKVLLDFLPSAENEHVAHELRRTLAGVAVRGGKVELVVVRAVNDAEPSRRAAAGVALAVADYREHRASVRRLLDDESSVVRAAVALQLAQLGEKASVPVLIRLFETLSRNELWLIEDMLYEWAGDKAPTIALGKEPAERAAFVKAWLAWWDKHGDKVKLNHKPAFRDWTLIVKLDEGIITELDSDDNPRFTIEKIAFSLDAQTLPGDRVLVAEYNGNRVSERARDGTVLWEQEASSPLVARRMPNGNTFIATKTLLFEVDREGNETFRHEPPPRQTFMRANRLPNGDVVYVTQDQRFIWLDHNGKTRLNLPANIHTSGGRIDVQPNGNFMLPQMYNNRVVEYDRDGKYVREFRIEQPIAAVRLANGHTLITAMEQKRAVEFDQTGKQVWEYKAETRVTRCLRR